MVKVKKYVITLCVMIITTMVALFTVSALTFWFKWQADKAMIGIIMTYVLAGLSGGVVLGLCEKKGVVLRQKNIRRRILQACFLAVLYLLVVQVICGIAADGLLGKKLGNMVVLAPPMLKMLPTMFAWPQLVTALIGGCIALLILPVLRKGTNK